MWRTYGSSTGMRCMDMRNRTSRSSLYSKTLQLLLDNPSLYGIPSTLLNVPNSNFECKILNGRNGPFQEGKHLP